MSIVRLILPTLIPLLEISKLHLSSATSVNASEEAEDEEACLAVSQSVRITAELCVFQRTSFEDLVPESYSYAVKFTQPFKLDKDNRRRNGYS